MSKDQFKLYALAGAQLNGESFLDDIDDLDDDDMTTELIIDEMKFVSALMAGAASFTKSLSELDEPDQAVNIALLKVYLKRTSGLANKLVKVCGKALDNIGADVTPKLAKLDTMKTSKTPYDASLSEWIDKSNYSWPAVSIADKKKKKEKSAAAPAPAGKHVDVGGGDGKDLENSDRSKVRKGTGFVRLTPKQLGLESDSDSSD
eukprot:GHVH01000069.1.p1 GENE.GHVH01000069.1~~GHVH01000069.1.p1  ORF type:complete len:204 (-),score=46.94 GHVH01000069.1:42-653(-)